MGNKTSSATPAPAPAAAAAAPSANVAANTRRLLASMPDPRLLPPVPQPAPLPAAAAAPATDRLEVVFANIIGKIPKRADVYLFMNDYLAHLKSIELSRGTSGLGSLIQKYLERRGPITSDDAAVAFVEWLLEPGTQRAIKIYERELVQQLQDLYSGRVAAAGLTGTAANLAIRSARLKYGQAGGSRRTKGRKAKGRKNRRRTAKRKHSA
jgi:hypothetical protein